VIYSNTFQNIEPRLCEVRLKTKTGGKQFVIGIILSGVLFHFFRILAEVLHSLAVVFKGVKIIENMSRSLSRLNLMKHLQAKIMSHHLSPAPSR